MNQVNSVTLSNNDMEELYKYYDSNFNRVCRLEEMSLIQKRKLYSIIYNIERTLRSRTNNKKQKTKYKK